MTQKEFLEVFVLFTIQYIEQKKAEDRTTRECIQLFLEQHHKEYFEVEHIRKDEDQVDHFTAQG